MSTQYARAIATLKPRPSAPSATVKRPKPARGSEYALLLSSASETVYPDLVCSELHSSPAVAFAAGLGIARAQPGLEVAVMFREPGGAWRDRKTGKTAREYIQATWAA